MTVIIKCSEMDEKKREKIASLVERFEEVNDEDELRKINEEIMKLLEIESRDDYDYYVIIGYTDEELNEEMIDDDFPFLTWSRRCKDPEFHEKTVIEIRQEL